MKNCKKNEKVVHGDSARLLWKKVRYVKKIEIERERKREREECKKKWKKKWERNGGNFLLCLLYKCPYKIAYLFNKKTLILKSTIWNLLYLKTSFNFHYSLELSKNQWKSYFNNFKNR